MRTTTSPMKVQSRMARKRINADPWDQLFTRINRITKGSHSPVYDRVSLEFLVSTLCDKLDHSYDDVMMMNKELEFYKKELVHYHKISFEFNDLLKVQE